MDFSSDAIAEIEGLLEVNRDFCKQQMAEKTSSALPLNETAIAKVLFGSFSQRERTINMTNLLLISAKAKRKAGHIALPSAHAIDSSKNLPHI